jgi:hypothetical protein
VAGRSSLLDALAKSLAYFSGQPHGGDHVRSLSSI